MLKVIDKIIKKLIINLNLLILGGGMGISYENNNKKLNYKKYNIAIKKFLKNINQKLYLNQVDL
jgi:diaminopimelate decarboxylase